MGKKRNESHKALIRILKGLPDTSPPTSFLVIYERCRVNVHWTEAGKPLCQEFRDPEDFRRFLKQRAAEAGSSIWSLDIEHFVKMDAALSFDREDWQYAQKIKEVHR